MELPCLPGYRLLRHLGGGKSFLVWQAEAEGYLKSVAVKFPRPAALEQPSTLVLLRREARAGRLVQHPGLVRILDSALAEPPYFIAMEYLPGESVKERLKRYGRFSTRRSVGTARQIAEALAALHAAGFVHADVKPANVLIQESGESKLIDLGFAHRRGENRKLIDAGFTIGTANYLAPELCLHPVREGPPADIFALGAMLFECLTGQVPYPADTVEEAMSVRRKRRPLDLSDYRGNWPLRVVQLVRAMLGREPHGRPSASAAARELIGIERDLIAIRPARPIGVIRRRAAG